jgi:hypothetical protein
VSGLLLDVTVGGSYATNQLQVLISRAPRLLSLTFRYRKFSSTILFQITSISIRQLYLSFDRTYDSAYCLGLISSPLGRQCELLSIRVKDRTSVLDLLNTMPQLRALCVRCDDDEWNVGRSLPLVRPPRDEFVDWLQCHSLSTLSIYRNTITREVWIRK